MKYKGKSLTNVNTKVVVLKKGNETCEITVASLSAGFVEKLTVIGLMDQPKVPKTVAKDAKGRVKKDEYGNVIQIIHDDDPGYRKAMEKWYERYLALQLREYLRLDPNLVFDTQEPTSMDLASWQDYADALQAELYGDGGFTDAEGSELMKVGRELGCVLANVDDEVDDFLPTQPTLPN